VRVWDIIEIETDKPISGRSYRFGKVSLSALLSNMLKINGHHSSVERIGI
jgi:hypothetical protein